jgi:hypothetical protein
LSSATEPSFSLDLSFNITYTTEPTIFAASQSSRNGRKLNLAITQVKSIDAANNHHRPHANDIAESPRHNTNTTRNALHCSTYPELTTIVPSESLLVKNVLD